MKYILYFMLSLGIGGLFSCQKIGSDKYYQCYSDGTNTEESLRDGMPGVWKLIEARNMWAGEKKLKWHKKVRLYINTDYTFEITEDGEPYDKGTWEVYTDRIGKANIRLKGQPLSSTQLSFHSLYIAGQAWVCNNNEILFDNTYLDGYAFLFKKIR